MERPGLVLAYIHQQNRNLVDFVRWQNARLRVFFRSVSSNICKTTRFPILFWTYLTMELPMRTESIESFDLVIIGAGIHGLATLKTYREVNPNASILVLDRGSSVGGVWAFDRLYPGLKTNNHFGTFEFSDLPMTWEGFGPDDHIPGPHVHDYLHTYAKKFNLLRHIRFQCVVKSAVDKGDDGWIITMIRANSAEETEKVIRASRLIVATGITSEPLMPTFVGRDEFAAPVYHSSEFARQSNGLGAYRNVVLFSGAKFSWDIACAYASAGIQVNWVIRQSGHGPCWMAPNRLSPLKVIPELLLQTRLISWLSPCIWGDADGYTIIRKFFARHWLGRKIVDKFFRNMGHSILKANDYDSHPETAKLKPWDDIFFVGTNRGLLNYDIDIFELVRKGMIRVHLADILYLSHQTVHLSTGESLPADLLVCGTGWKDTPPIDFITRRDLGLPGSPTPIHPEYISRADLESLDTCPKLREQPQGRKTKPLSDSPSESSKEPYRLYRFMVPPAFIESRTLAFAGAYRSPSTTIIAQAQALWITAFLGGCIPSLTTTSYPPIASNNDTTTAPTDTLDNENRVLYETILHSQFGKWRYSRGFGARFPELWMDCIPYIDMMLRDVGVKWRRKDRWWQECLLLTHRRITKALCRSS
jgi:hypothetical protein